MNEVLDDGDPEPRVVRMAPEVTSHGGLVSVARSGPVEAFLRDPVSPSLGRRFEVPAVLDGFGQAVRVAVAGRELRVIPAASARRGERQAGTLPRRQRSVCW